MLGDLAAAVLNLDWQSAQQVRCSCWDALWRVVLRCVGGASLTKSSRLCRCRDSLRSMLASSLAALTAVRLTLANASGQQASVSFDQMERFSGSSGCRSTCGWRATTGTRRASGCTPSSASSKPAATTSSRAAPACKAELTLACSRVQSRCSSPLMHSQPHPLVLHPGDSLSDSVCNRQRTQGTGGNMLGQVL